MFQRWCLSIIYDTNHCLHVHVSIVHRYSFSRLMTWRRPKWPPPLTKDWVTIVNGSVASSLYALCYTLRRACVCLRRYIRRQLAPLLGVSYFFSFFSPNTRNTRGVTKGFPVGECQQSHYAKYEYPPDDSKHVLPGGRHTWSTVRRWRTPSHLSDVCVP